MNPVFLSNQAQKDLKEIPLKNRLKIKQKLELLEQNPLLGKKLGGKLKDYRSLKIWPYRAIYEVFKNKEVWLVHISHRQKAYK